MIKGKNIEATFCFADIAGYTALTDSHGEVAAADLIDDFNELIRLSVEPPGKIQELTGDCAFLVFPDPFAARDALSNLFKIIANRANFPIIRAGLHHGPALLRENRYFGSSVNLASRVAAKAKGGQILCTKPIVDFFSREDMPDIEIVHQGLISLKNFPQPVDLFEIILPGLSHEYVIDPVCKMQVDKIYAVELSFKGDKYWFCSPTCVERFTKEPASYSEQK
jgi:class 3 adenylate cyclase/YHS domain-containing protein